MRIVQTTPHDLRVERRPEPVPSDGEVLVRVAAASVNLIDKYVVAGFFHQMGVIAHARSLGLGWDLVGTVSAGPRRGERVAAVRTGTDTPTGTFGEVVVVPEQHLAAVPSALDTRTAAAVGMNALAAAQALDLAGAPSGRTILVTGAAGSVGGYAIELAGRAGWDVTGLARPTDATFVRTAGAEPISELPVAASRRWDVVLDAAGIVFEPDALAATLAPYIAEGGTFIGVRGVVPLPAGFAFQTTAVEVTADGPRLGELLQLAAEGSITPRVGPVFPLEQIDRAVEAVGTPGNRGRVIVDIGLAA